MKVSVVTPSYNQARFIKRTLESVATQTDVEVEHLVFDGGSIDDTVEVLKRFGRGVRWISGISSGSTSISGNSSWLAMTVAKQRSMSARNLSRSNPR